MDAGRFDALARALTSGASRRRLLQTLPGLAVGAVLPWSSTARALDAGNEPVARPAGGDAPACTGGADCATGEICLNGYCQAADGAATTGGNDALSCPTAAPSGAGVSQAPTATAASGRTPAAAAGGTAPTPNPSAVADGPDADAAGAPVPATQTPTSQADDPNGGPADPTPRAITTPEGQGGQTSNPTPTATATAVADIPADQPLAAQIHEGVCGALDDTPAFPLIDIGAGPASGATPVADDGTLGAESAIPARLSTTIVDTTLADLLANPFAVDIRLTADDPETSIACGEVGAVAIPSGANPQVAVGLASQNGSGYAGIASLLEQNGRTVVTVFVAPGLGGGTTAEFAAGDPTDQVAAPAAPSPLAAGATATLTEDSELRAAPRRDASVVGSLSEGATVIVTAAAVDGWVPVRDPETDRPGYVDAEHLTPEE